MPIASWKRRESKAGKTFTRITTENACTALGRLIFGVSSSVGRVKRRKSVAEGQRVAPEASVSPVRYSRLDFTQFPFVPFLSIDESNESLFEITLSNLIPDF